MSANTLMQLVLVLPLCLVPLILLLRNHPNLREGASILFGVLQFALVWQIFGHFENDQSLTLTWFTIFPGLPVAFEVEPLGLIFALVASSLWPLTTLYAIGYMRSHNEQNQTRFYTFFAIAIFAVMGIAFAQNLMTLFIFYEVLTLSTFPLVTHAGTENAKKGGRIYLGILLTTSILFFLLAVIGTWVTAGTLDFKLNGIFASDASNSTLGILLALFIFGIGKAAIMPFHKWLPSAMVAPTPVSSLLHAVAVVKAGVFTVIKVCVYTFGIERLGELPSTEFLAYLAGFTILASSIIALRQNNLKARLAYSTVSQLGYVTMGALLATPLGIIGSSMHITMHAFSKITLFFCAGAIMVAAHKKDVDQMQGLGKQMPLTFIAFAIASLGIIGLPPAGGTWSKWFLLMGTVESEYWILMVVLMLSSLLSIAYLLTIPLRAFFPKEQPQEELTLPAGKIDLAPTASLVALTLTAIACIFLFWYADAIYHLASKLV